MKKRLLSALLALALVFVLLPTTALADTTPVTDEKVKINGTAVIVGNDISLGEGNGTYSYDEATHTLTLNSATINATGSNIGISFGVPVKGNINYRIELEGKNTITSTSAQAIYVEHDTSVEAWEKDTMKRSTLTINGSAGSSLNLSVSGSKEAIEAIWSKGDFTLSGGTAVTAFSSGTIAVNVGSMTINNSKLSAQSSSYGTTVVLYGFEMIGDAAEFEALNTSSSVRAVLRTSGASENIDWSNYQFTTGSYSGNALTKSEPTVCDKNTLNELFSSSSTTRYIHIAKRTIPALQRTSDVLIAKENAVVGQWTNIPAAATGTGSYYYDADKKELTLKDVNITHSDGAIVQFMAGAPYIIKLEGTNSIKDVNSFIRVPERGYESLDGLSVTISGAGSLEVIARGNAITMLKGNLIFNNTGAIALETTTINGKAINVSGNISIGDDFNKNLRITADNGDMTFDPTNQYTDYNDLKNYKSITIASKPSETYYNSTAMKYGETRNAGSGTISCDENGVITLNGATEGTLEFRSSADSTLVLEGTNTLSSIVTTQMGLTISGSGSLTAGSIKVTNNDNISADLTITDGAAVIAKSNATRAIDIKGDLTVTNGSLTATSKSDSVPTVQVGGNASFTGSTVTITNNSTALHKDAADATKGDSVSSALYVKGNINTDNANVTAKVENGGGNAIGALGNITVNGSTVTAVNKGQKFTTIIAENVYVSGDSKITANNLNENPVYNGSYLAFPAIEGNIVNQNTDYSLKFKGQHNGTSVPKTTLAPGEQTTLYYYNVTITRGDEVARTESPVVIAGTTLLNDTYYTITNDSTVVANGSESNYNAFYDSETKTLKLNNAQISTTTNNAAIKIREDLTITVTGTNELNGNYNHCIESDNNFKINGTGRLVMTNGSNTAASVIYCGPYKNLTIAAEVIIKNEAQPGYLIHIDKKDAYSFAEGYNVYASTNVSGSPLEVYNPENYSAYKYLRVTKETLETGGGSTHEHVFSTSWESNADYHWHKCTVQGCTEVSDKEAHVYTNTWWKNSNGNHGRTCDKCRHEGEIHEFIKYYDFADETYHVERCGYLNCTYVGRQETHSYDSFGVCKCGYSPNGLPAPPSLQGVAPTSENGTDGKILNSNIGMEYAQNLNGPWTKWNEHSNITGLSAGTYYVRYTKTDERFPDNQVATVEVPAYTPGGDPTPDIPAAPTGLVGVAPTSENGNGKITGTTAQMEYATSLEGDWTACANDSTDVPAGKYYVRMKKTDNTPAGEAVEVTVPAYSGTGEIVPPTPDNPGTIVIIRPAEEEKPAQQPNPSTGANDLVGLSVAAAVAAALGSAALLRKHD